MSTFCLNDLVFKSSCKECTSEASSLRQKQRGCSEQHLPRSLFLSAFQKRSGTSWQNQMHVNSAGKIMATWSTLKQGLKYLRPIWSHMFQGWSIMFWYVLIVQINVKKVLLLISSNLGKIQLLGNLLGILCVDEAKEVHFHVGCVGLSGTIKLLDHGTSFHNSQSNLRFEDDIKWTNWRWLLAKWFPKMRKIFHKSAGPSGPDLEKLEICTPQSTVCTKSQRPMQKIHIGE